MPATLTIKLPGTFAETLAAKVSIPGVRPVDAVEELLTAEENQKHWFHAILGPDEGYLLQRSARPGRTRCTFDFLFACVMHRKDMLACKLPLNKGTDVPVPLFIYPVERK